MQGREQQRLNSSHTPSFFLGSNSLLPLPCPASLRGARHQAELSHYHQLYPAAPFSTLFPCSRVGSHPRATVPKEKPAARGAVVPSGNSHMPQCKSCGEHVDPCSGLARSKGCRGVHVHWSPAQGSRGISPLMPAVLSPLSSHLAAHRAVPNSTGQLSSLLSPASAASLLPGPETRAKDTHLFTCTISDPCSCPGDTGNASALEQCRKKSKNQKSLYTRPSLRSHQTASTGGWGPSRGWRSDSQEQSNSRASRGLWGFTLWDLRAKTLGGAAEAGWFL